MWSWSISAGHLFGREIRLHWTFLALLVFIASTEYPAQGSVNAAHAIALVGIVFACVVIHELGHAFAAMYAGEQAKAIILLPIGGITILDDSRQFERRPANAWLQEVRVALAGPFVSIVVAFVCGSILLAVAPEVQLWTRPHVHSNHLLRSVVWINLYLAGLNLLPAYPLDGGRVLRAFFTRTMDPVMATRRAVTIGQSFAMVFMLTGMLSNPWLTLIGFFLFIGGQLEERTALFHSVLQKVRLEDIMLTDFATLSPADTLEDALDKAVHTLQDDFPVIRGGDMVGVISRQKILDALRSDGNGYVQSVMNRIFEVSDRQESLEIAFRKLTSKNLNIVPVVEDQRLVGIVTLQNLMHSMALLAESRKLRREALNS